MSFHGVEASEVTRNVQAIFGETHITTAFLTGSIAAGSATETSDVDIFVSHDGNVRGNAREDFTDYYLNLHDRLGRVPDTISPGEVMSNDELYAGLQRVQDMEPVFVIDRPIDFDYICWAGMLVSKKEFLVPPNHDFETFEGLSKKVMKKWVKGLYGSPKTTYATGLDTDPDKMLARSLSSPGYYDAHQ